MKTFLRGGAAALLVAVQVTACGSKTDPGPTESPFEFSPISGSALASGRQGVAYTATIQVTTGGGAPFLFTLLSGPPGLALAEIDSQTTNLTGTPSQVFVGTVSVRVTDSVLHVSNASYPVRIDAATPDLTVTPGSLPNPVRPQPYSQFLSESGGIAPFAWSLSGSLPPGLVFGTSTGATNGISGTATTPGTYAFTVTVTDGSQPARTGSRSYTLVVN